MPEQTTVSLRTIIKRINRKLEHDGEKLRAARDPQTLLENGPHFIVGVRVKNVDPQALARELGVLRPDEQIGQVR
ncbi:MAG TPA: hypothetical protein VK754_15650 [Propionibacteriaceae bacterium]|nr:hypothetical protein [Propionibacteriaceae bacterium]